MGMAVWCGDGGHCRSRSRSRRSMIEKYLGIVGNEVDCECLGGLNLNFVFVVSI